MVSRWHLRFAFIAIAALLLVGLLIHKRQPPRVAVRYDAPPQQQPLAPVRAGGKLDWENVPHRYPVPFPRELPSLLDVAPIPRIQARFARETRDEKRVRLWRLGAVWGNFTHAWKGYKEHAWLRDEVSPLSGAGQDPFGGWAATLVDSLGMFPFTLCAIGALRLTPWKTLCGSWA
jgi:hypothetical protein